MGDYFDPSLPDLQDTLPDWLAKADPGSELYKVLAVFAEFADELAEEAEGIALDMAMSTARDDALRNEWALLYGVSAEQLPFDTETLRAYLKQRAADDGSLIALEQALLSLLLVPANGTPPAPQLQFPADGSGLEFPVDGSGLEFPTTSWLELIEHPTDHYIAIFVRNYLVFDRPAFARAVARARMADDLPSTITETPS